MQERNKIILVWLSVLSLFVFMLGFVFLGKYLPPHSPAMGAKEVADFYADNQLMRNFGLLLVMVASAMLYPLVGLISSYTRRIEDASPALTYVQLMCWGSFLVLFYMPVVFWGLAGYRPERSPELIQLLNDMAWMTIIFPTSAGVLMWLFMGINILSDKSAVPIFPRWSGYFNIWIGLLLFPGAGAIFFHAGPFAWSGMFAFWIPLVALCLWYWVMSAVMLQVIKRDMVGELADRTG